MLKFYNSLIIKHLRRAENPCVIFLLLVCNHPGPFLLCLPG